MVAPDRRIAAAKAGERMWRKILLGAGILILLLGFMGSAWARKSRLERARDRFEPIPKTPPALMRNPLTPDKIQLGKMLLL